MSPPELLENRMKRLNSFGVFAEHEVLTPAQAWPASYVPGWKKLRSRPVRESDCPARPPALS